MTGEEFKKMSTLEQVRVVSGIITITGEHEVDVSILTSRLAFINLIVRGELGLADKEFVSNYIDKVFAKTEKTEEAPEEKEDESKA